MGKEGFNVSDRIRGTMSVTGANNNRVKKTDELFRNELSIFCGLYVVSH